MASRYVNVRNNRPNVIIMGSPIAFPNYKIPFLVQDVGLTLTDTIDCSVLKQELLHENIVLNGNCENMIKSIASAWYDKDASSSFIRNNALFDYISRIVQKRDIEGVVYHVLKGQIEYDFELERFETLFSKYNIPVFRLETDYQYQEREYQHTNIFMSRQYSTANRIELLFSVTSEGTLYSAHKKYHYLFCQHTAFYDIARPCHVRFPVPYGTYAGHYGQDTQKYKNQRHIG